MYSLTFTHPHTLTPSQVVESCVEKLRKPDKAIFDITLERLGVAASEAVFLDDIGGNLKTAKQMGMETIKVKQSHFNIHVCRYLALTEGVHECSRPLINILSDTQLR